MKTPGERLKKIRHLFGLTQARFAEKLGLKWEKIKDIETGRHKFRPEIAKKIEEVYGISSNWLLTGEGDIFIQENPIDEDIIILSKKSNFIDVPLYDIVLRQNKNNKDYELNILYKSYLKFSPEFLKSLEIQDYNKICLFIAKDESMESIININDLVLLDKGDKNIIPGKIYGIRVDRYIFFRKVFFDYSKNFILKSENKKDFDDIVIPEDKFNSNLLGRVKWIGKKI